MIEPRKQCRMLSGLLIGLVLLWVFPPTEAEASTRSFGGTIESVGPINEEAMSDRPTQRLPDERETLRVFNTRTSFLYYTSDAEEPVGQLRRENVTNLGSVCMLNGELMDVYTFARALRPGMWGQIYEEQWFDLYTLPRFEWGELVAHNADQQNLTIRKQLTTNPFHLKRNPPVRQDVSYEGAAIELEGESADAKALRPGRWVQVHPPRKQLVSVRTPDAAYDADQQLPYWRGRRGFANDLTAPARLRGYTILEHNDTYSPGTTLEVTRVRDGNLEDITLRGGPALFLDGRAAPPSVALRVGRPMALICYRADRGPHQVFLWSDDDTVRGTIKSVDVDKRTLTVEVLDRVTGEPLGQTVTVALRDDARYELNGRPAESTAALKPGRRVAVFAERGRLLRVFEPRKADAPVFGVGGTVEGRVVGQRARPYDQFRMQRLDLNLGHGLLGPTRVSHRRLHVSATFRAGKAVDLRLHNFAEHERGPAWAADIVEQNITLKDGRLRGRLVIDVEPRPKQRPSPVTGGRYMYDFDGSVKANHVHGSVAVTLDDKSRGARRLTGDAVAMPDRRAPFGNAVYALTLEDPQLRVRPMTLHLRTHDNRFTEAIATVPGFGAFPVDVSDLRLEGPWIRGQVIVHMPAHAAGLDDAKPLAVRVNLTVKAVADAHVGEFKSVFAARSEQPPSTR